MLECVATEIESSPECRERDATRPCQRGSQAHVGASPCSDECSEMGTMCVCMCRASKSQDMRQKGSQKCGNEMKRRQDEQLGDGGGVRGEGARARGVTVRPLSMLATVREIDHMQLFEKC